MEENKMPVDTLRGPLDLLVIQPTPFCNLDCDYCYLPFRQVRDKISPEVLRAIFTRVFASGIVEHGFTVVWHAGEPLVLPVAFYQEALEIIAEENRENVEVGHSFQTNGTLLNPGWCRFLKEKGLAIGVSVDGPAFIHDRHRKTRSRRGTFQQVVRGIKLLGEYQVPFHVITVLTADSLDYPDELFDFYLEHGIRQIGFNIEEIEGPHTTSSLSALEMQERYTAFLSRFLDLIDQSAERLSVREFDSAIASIRARDELLGNGPQLTTPFAVINVDCHGNFSTFSPELLGLASDQYDGFTFGNVLTDSLDAACNHPNYRAVERDVLAGVSKCSEHCEYFPYCGGGSPVNKLFENGTFDSTETLFCRLSRKVVIDVVLAKLEWRYATVGEKA
jgi:uncharacterized protein